MERIKFQFIRDMIDELDTTVWSLFKLICTVIVVVKVIVLVCL